MEDDPISNQKETYAKIPVYLEINMLPTYGGL